MPGRATVLAKAKVKVAEAMSTTTGRAMRLYFWLLLPTATSDDSCRDDGGDVDYSSRVNPCHGAASIGYRWLRPWRPRRQSQVICIFLVYVELSCMRTTKQYMFRSQISSSLVHYIYHQRHTIDMYIYETKRGMHTVRHHNKN